MEKINGIIPAIPTIFNDNMDIDFTEIGKCIKFAIKSGAEAIAPMLLGGEFYKLTFLEKIELIRYISKFRYSIKILIGVSEPATFSVIKLAKEAFVSGVHGIILMPPYYYPYGKLDNSLIIKHFTEVSKAVDMPVIIQDFGFRANIPLKLLKTIIENNKNIAGIKTEGNGSAERIRLLHSLYPDLSILGGYLGFNMANEFNNGSDGSITGLAFMDILSRIYRKYQNNDNSYRDDFLRVQNILGFEAENLKFFVRIEKEVLYKRGIIKYIGVRQPEPEMPESIKYKLKILLDKSGIE